MIDIFAYIPILDAFALLLKPLIEVVIHDVATDKIIYINGNLSKRAIGDPSLLSPEELEANIDKIVYEKVELDGRMLKSISVPIDTQWLICINCDVSFFSLAHNFCEQLMVVQSKAPESLFKNDWQEQLHRATTHFLKNKTWNFNELSGRQKKELIKHLWETGAFSEKNAADYIARFMNMGRATIFKYLKEWRNP